MITIHLLIYFFTFFKIIFQIKYSFIVLSFFKSKRYAWWILWIGISFSLLYPVILQIAIKVALKFSVYQFIKSFYLWTYFLYICFSYIQFWTTKSFLHLWYLLLENWAQPCLLSFACVQLSLPDTHPISLISFLLHADLWNRCMHLCHYKKVIFKTFIHVTIFNDKQKINFKSY